MRSGADFHRRRRGKTNCDRSPSKQSNERGIIVLEKIVVSRALRKKRRFRAVVGNGHGERPETVEYFDGWNAEGVEITYRTCFATEHRIHVFDPVMVIPVEQTPADVAVHDSDDNFHY